MKFFGLSLIALLAGSVVASPVPSDSAAAVSNAKQSSIADIVSGLDAEIKDELEALLSEAGLVKRGNDADAVASLDPDLEEELEALLGETDLIKRQDTSSILADIDEIVSQIKEQYGVSKRDEVSDLLSTLTGLLGDLSGTLGL
jgi:hypothetical protein